MINDNRRWNDEEAKSFYEDLQDLINRHHDKIYKLNADTLIDEVACALAELVKQELYYYERDTQDPRPAVISLLDSVIDSLIAAGTEHYMSSK